LPIQKLVGVDDRAADEIGELKSQFLASLSYEIRTPLTGILGNLDLLLETDLSSDQREYALDSHLSAQNVLLVINATLEYSALMANQVALEEAEFDLRGTMADLTGEFSPQGSAKGLVLIENVDPDLPQVVIGDEFRIRQLLAYLITNAIKYTSQGEVEVCARVLAKDEQRLSVSVSVRDTGIGIPPGHLDAIFQPFRQSESGPTRRYSGMGLGLALSQQLARLMGSEVRVVSAVGQGSTFSVDLSLGVPREPALSIIRKPRTAESPQALETQPVLQEAIAV